MARTVRRASQKLGKIARAQIEEARHALRRGSQKIQNTAVDKIVSGPKTGRKYRRYNPKRLHTASAPGEPPAKDEGVLHTTITVADESRPGVLRYSTGTNSPYADDLELGNSKIKPRPFMGPSFDENIGAIRADIRNALRRGARRG